MIDLEKAIIIAARTGNNSFGAKNAIKNAKVGKAKLIVITENCPKNLFEDIVYYCKLSGIPFVIYRGTNLALGKICGKPFMVSALSIRYLGNSDILKVAEAVNV